MTEPSPESYQTLPLTVWTTPQNREESEKNVGIPLGAYSYKFEGSQAAHYRAVRTMALGAVQDFVEGAGVTGLRLVEQAHYDNPDGSFSGGTLFVGAPTREMAELYEGFVVKEINNTLHEVGGNIRLQEFSPHR